MKEMLLLGAGASVDAKVPTAHDMSSKLLDLFQTHPDAKEDCRQAINFVARGLAFKQSADSSDPFRGVDIEELFRVVENLSRADDLEIAPFIGQWHPAIDRFNKQLVQRALGASGSVL